MVTKAILEVSIRGLGKFGRTSIFPCSIFQCMTGVNRKEGDPNYDLFKLALKSTAQRLYPNYANCDWSGNNYSVDREDKKKVIESLTEEEKAKLIDVIVKNPEIGAVLTLDVDEDNKTIKVKEEWSPTEIFSTMGKRKL